MHESELLVPEARARLSAARILLHETRGFLYLPVLAETQVAAAAALDFLLSDGQGVAPFQIAWPPFPGQAFAATPPDPAEREYARRQLLENLDHAIAVQAKGALLVLDASPSDRHRLALETVSYLNQRREALRRLQLRLILLWPADQAQALMAGAPDLWSMRALAPVIAASEVLPSGVGGEFQVIETPAGHADAGLSPSQERQWRRWLEHRELGAAGLSVADAMDLLPALDRQRDWLAVSDLSEDVLRHLQDASDPDRLAWQAESLSWLAIARSQRGDRKGALEPARRAVEIYEKLAAENFAAYAPALASSLNNLSNRLAESGDRAGGLAAIRRAVEIREKLAAENFAAYAPDLAMSLNNLSNRLGESGDRAGGLAAIRRAVEIHEKLAAENFAAYAPDLAMSLNNLSNRLGESGDRAGGLAAIRRAVEIYEKLAAENFAAYAPDLAMSLNNLSVRLGESGDRAGGLAAVERAIEIITPFALPGTFYEDWLATMRKTRKQFTEKS